MGSFKSNGRNHKLDRRRGKSSASRQGLPRIETLEDRRLLSGGSNPTPIWKPTDPGNLADAQNGPMANLGASAVNIYEAYIQSGDNTSSLTQQFPGVEFQGGNVGLQLKMLYGGDFSQFLTQVQDAGMQVSTSSAYYDLVEGFAPINDLPALAELGLTQSGQVNYAPVTLATTGNTVPLYQGTAYNEAVTSMSAAAARTQFTVDGTGTTVGVISDSVSQYQGGLAASYKTGDLNANNPVNVITDGPAGSTDEGRAMLENIHDIAPGANLAFSAGGNSVLSMAQSVTALATQAHSNVVVDDLRWFNDPFFQPGVISQAIDSVTAQGTTYVSAAGNYANQGYLSTFNPMSGSITGIGSGTFMNFNPGGTATNELPIKTSGSNTEITFQFDQPFQSQEPAGATGKVTSQVDIYVIDATNGNVVVGAAQNSNTVATQSPLQLITIPSAGSYYIAVQVVSGANPGHIEFVNDIEGNQLTITQETGAAAGTIYPSSIGHSVDPNTIGVGATPWWVSQPFASNFANGQLPSPLPNEPFSSFGPALQFFDANGNALPSPVTLQQPTVTGSDGGNTSFFTPGQVIDTTQPIAFPGEPNSPDPVTNTNAVPTNQQNLPTFFGTSSASPNVAAIAALMKQLNPAATPAQIKASMISAAAQTPMNGQSAGSWNQQSGYGFLNAVDALTAIDQLQVSTTTPANGSTVTTAPSVIQVTFNKPVVASSLSAADLSFSTVPTGVTVNVGAPIPIDSTTAPTIVDYPISFTRAGGVTANGNYSYTVASPASGSTVVATDGHTLVPSNPISFALQDTTNPVVTNTSINGRTVSITFSKAIDPSTALLQNFLVLRQGSNTTWPPTPSTIGNYINLNADPRATISYNPLTYTVTLDYSALPQSEMPTDSYAVVVLTPNGNAGTGGGSGVTDLVGNDLYGYYTGSFPSGPYVTQVNGTSTNEPYDFIQNLGLQQLQAPVITTFTMSPSSDTGIPNDQNTTNNQPTFVGSVYVPFPGSIANNQIIVQFQGTPANNGAITLAASPSGYGYSVSGTLGVNYVTTTTDANGTFTITPPSSLLEGFENAVAVAVGQPSYQNGNLSGLSSQRLDSFRIDNSAPQITSAALTASAIQSGTNLLPLPGSTTSTTNLSALSSLYLGVVDPIHQGLSALGTPSTVIFSALDPSTATNTSNYSLINSAGQDYSSYITGATYTPTTTPLTSGNYSQYTGYIQLSFAPGLPAGVYTLTAHAHDLLPGSTSNYYPGITDAAGNYINDSSVAGEGSVDFKVNIAIQTTPAYITGMALESVPAGSTNFSTAIGGPQSYFELPPANGANTRDNIPAPPNTAVIDLSNPIPYVNSTFYNSRVLLIGSTNPATTTNLNPTPDGNFGTLGQGGLGASDPASGYTIVGNTTVTLYYLNTTNDQWTPADSAHPGTRLVLTYNGGTPLPADYYRVYMPNQVDKSGTDTRIYDIYGNQLDGEFLGNPTSQNSTVFSPPAAYPNITIPQYQDQLSSGQTRIGLSGDGVAGGAFMTGFVVVPYGNVVYARPDFVENPLVPNGAGLSNGSPAAPYPVLAPEGDPTNTALAANPTHNPNLGLNNPAFFQPGNYNPLYNYSGQTGFQQSAFYAASQLALLGPVVIVAEPGLPSRNPITGTVSQASFSLIDPTGSTNPGASVPFDTTLVFQAGATMKFQGTSLFVQNQGSALQSQGTIANPVNFTSYNNAAIAGATNGNPDNQPHAGDWGGLVFRSYDESANAQQFPVDGTLIGTGTNGMALSGAQSAMSILNFTDISYAGGPSPLGTSNFYSAVTLYNDRPMLTNMNIAQSGTSSAEGAIAADMNSLREDDTARGPLVRNVTTTGNSINGFYLMAQPNGFIEPTNAVPYPANPSNLGGVQNYTIAEPLPIVITAQLVLGQQFLENTGGNTQIMGDRLYIQPGSILKFNKGSALDVIDPSASLNVGARTYMNGFDANPNYSPTNFAPYTSFQAEGLTDSQVIFTSIYDNTASTPFVPAIDVTGVTSPPTLGPSLWGSVGIVSGADVVINNALFEYGGGAVNTQDFTLPSQSVLAFITYQSDFPLPASRTYGTQGTHAYITNNTFKNNFDAAMQIEPNGLLAANPLTPLASGHPFFRNNVMTGNGIDGLAVVTNRSYVSNATATGIQYIGPQESIVNGGSYANQTVNAVWDSTDLTYVLRGTVVLGQQQNFFNQNLPTPNTSAFTNLQPPTVSLTIQAALPGTLLADGSTIPSPGQSVIVKLLNDNTPNGAGSLSGLGSQGLTAGNSAGAGFALGVDNGVDPTSDPLIDGGVQTALRILGIPGNQTTGQQRVPVIITSLRDGSVGTTVRGVQMYNILNSDPTWQANHSGASLTSPAAGDGGYIYIGGNSQTEYNPYNPFDGSYITNADISYMTRIEVQGGGILNTYNDLSGKPGTPTLSTASWWQQLSGYLAPVNQLNAPMTLTVSDSNLADFADAAIFAHPNANGIAVDWTGANGGVGTAPGTIARTSLGGEPVYLNLYNDTISNSPVGVAINSQTGNDTTGDSPFIAIIQNVTFNNDGYGIQTVAPVHSNSPDNSFASVQTLAMNDIFSNITNDAINIQGQAGESLIQYDLFYNNGADVVAPNDGGQLPPPYGTFDANPNYVGPVGGTLPATAQNYNIQSNSPAIDAGRSEIGPNDLGNALYPGVNISLTGGQIVETRTNPANLPAGEVPGQSNLFGIYGGGSGNGYDSRQIVTLPGTNFFSFPTLFQPVLTTDPTGYTGTSTVPGTYNYQPYSGIRDILGYIRVPDPNVPGVGYGSNPFIDIGAYQYVNLHPPEVTGVTATVATSTSSSSSTGTTKTIPFYTVGGTTGSNTTPQTINVAFNEPIDPNTLNGNTVQLEELGVAPGTSQKFISLQGKTSYNSATDSLVITLAGLSLPTDEYRLILFGSGSPVIQNTQGIALDGENLSNNNNPTNGTQLALPSGNGYPGGNFYDSFIINTTPPSINSGSLQMAASSDSNIVGDSITNVTTPTFTGSISEPTSLVPLAGQTVTLNVGIALNINGTVQDFYNASQLPAGYSQYAQYIRPNAGTGLTDTSGNFSVTVGTDGAGTGLVTNTSGLPNLFPILNVGSSGQLSPLTGTDSGYYVVQAVATDQSGNSSNPSSSVPFVVDTTPPTVSITSPTSDQTITSLTNGGIQFTITTSKNIDLTHFNASSIQVTTAGTNGTIGGTGAVTVPINPNSIQVTYLDAGTGGPGREQITFTTQGTLTNNLYQVTLLNTGSDPVEDIAGNVIASPVSQQFVVDVPSLSTVLYVGAASYVTNTGATQGTRENPYPTITDAMNAAVIGDVVAVLPGVYTESVTMKPFVRLFSAAASSTDSTVFTTSTGNPLATIIRAPQITATATSNQQSTIIANGLSSFPGLSTEIAGFTIASPLLGDPASGTINTAASAIQVINSNILLDKNYIADAGIGIAVQTSGSSAQTPQIENDVIVGNIIGMQIQDAGGTSASTQPAQVINNDFNFNTVGLYLLNSASSPLQAYVANNIFWQNHDQTTSNNGFAIESTNPNMVNLRNNMFQGNGSDTSLTSDTTATNNLGNGFSSAILSSTVPDSQGNFVGSPQYAQPIDPRPGGDGPANLFVSSNFDLTAASAAIDNAYEPSAIPTDILGNSQVKIGNDGFGLPGFGPRDIGAYEFNGIGGIPLGGAFRVVTSSIVPNGGAPLASGGTKVVATSPTSITLSFSWPVSPTSLKASDLVLSGSADSNNVQPTSLTWIDPETVQFNLSGPLNVPGTLDLSLPANQVSSTNGLNNIGYSDNVVLQIGNPVQLNPTPYQPTPISSPSPGSPIGVTLPTVPGSPVVVSSPIPTTPIAVPSPVGFRHHHKKAHPTRRPFHHAVPHHKPVHHRARQVAHKAKGAHAHAHVAIRTAEATPAFRYSAAHPHAHASLTLSFAGPLHHRKGR